MQNGLKDALGLDDPVFALPSAGSSDEAEDIPPAGEILLQIVRIDHGTHE